MRRYLGVAAFAASALTSAAGPGEAASRAPAVKESVAVTSLAVMPAAGRAEVVIGVGGAVDVQDFTLDNGRRVVIDIKGATLGIKAQLYDKVQRAGIANVRFSQFKSDVVRVVLDLDGPREYRVVKGDHDVRVSVNGPDDFQPWRVGARGAVTSVAADKQATPAIKTTSSAMTGAVASSGAPTSEPVSKTVSKPMSSASSPAPIVPTMASEPVSAPPGAKSTILPNNLTRAPKSGEDPQQSTQPRVSVAWTDAAMKDVITQFADFSGRSIVVGPAVTGTVTVSIVDQPWDVAFKNILDTYGFAAKEDSTGVITVDSYDNLNKRAQVEPLFTRVIPVNYTQADVMATTVKSLLGAGCGGGAAAAAAPAAGGAAAVAPAGGSGAICSSRGSVASDQKTNSLIVTETASRLADIESYIKDLDVRTAQVAIRAKIIAVDRTGSEALGISYNFGSNNGFSTSFVTPVGNGQTNATANEYKVNLAGDAIAGVANSSRSYRNGLNGTPNSISLLYNMALGGFNLTTFLDALASVQLTDVQAEPSTTTVDNKQAELFAGQTITYLLTPPVPAGQLTSVAPQIGTKDIGIKLRVTPHVTANRQVLLDIYAEQQVLQEITAAGPNTSNRNTTNQVLVGDGETAVIGGLTQTQVVRNRTGIPVLMDLPGIGRLFRQSDMTERKQDLLILVTPHIVDEGEVKRP